MCTVQSNTFFFICNTESVSILTLPYHLCMLDQQVLVGHSIPIPLELTPALIMCCDAVTTCDYTIYSFVIPEYKLTYFIFWMAL